MTKRGSNFCFWTGIVFLTGQVIFCPKMAKEGVCWFVIGHILLDKIISL
jgi:hypothetical protein